MCLHGDILAERDLVNVEYLVSLEYCEVWVADSGIWAKQRLNGE